MATKAEKIATENIPIELIPIKDLKYDSDLQPRKNKIDYTHLRRMTDALESGVVFPAIIVDRATRKIVDGIHRYHAVKKIHGEESPINCKLVKFAEEKDMFLFAVEENSKNGLPWYPNDRAHIAIEAERRGIPLNQLSKPSRCHLTA